MKKKIFILTLSDLRYDARVRRQVEALKHDYDITLAGFNGEPSADYELVPISSGQLTFYSKVFSSVFLLLRFHETAHRILYSYLPVLKKKLAGKTFDLVLANDVETLPLAFSLPGHHKVLFDAHEYAPRHFEDKLMWRIFFRAFNQWLCKKYLPMTAGMMTVGQGLADEYRKHYPVNPVVIPNATHFFDLKPSPVLPDKIRMVHVGIANPSRRLELMIELMELLDDRFTLDMFLLTPGFASRKTRNYIDGLFAAAKHGRVNIYPPIKSTDIVQTINRYDLGVFLLPPINFNYENTLPNKLFDFIQARLGVAIGPSPEMAAIVRQYGNGIVAEDFSPSSLASELKKLTSAAIEQFKKNSGRAAADINAGKSAIVLRNLVASILG